TPAAIGAALVGALSDSDRFVCWAAARAINRLRFVSSAAAVRPLSRMVRDSDFDLQMIAITTLASYGPDAADALENLIVAVKKGDSDVKRNAMRTLEAIGSGAKDAIPV